jgi:hypothetical protein
MAAKLRYGGVRDISQPNAVIFDLRTRNQAATGYSRTAQRHEKREQSNDH